MRRLRGSGRPQEPKFTPSGRPIPPENTGHEPEYLAVHCQAKTPVVVHLLDGEQVRGRLEYYDRDVLKLSRPDAADLLVRKDEIRYLYAEQEIRRRRRPPTAP